MSKLFTLSPFIWKDSSSNKPPIVSTILEYSYLFNIYSYNPYIVKEYMDFINLNFDNVFKTLDLQVIYYEFPDKLKNDESSIINYINNKYNLDDNAKIDRCYYANIFNIIDPYTKKEYTMYFNDYTLYDLSFSNKGIFDIESDILDNLYYLSDYLSNRDIIDLIKSVILRYYEYNDISMEQSMYVGSIGEIDIINEPLYILGNLKSFVKYTTIERSE